jgi:polyphenol oxidase
VNRLCNIETEADRYAKVVPGQNLMSRAMKTRQSRRGSARPEANAATRRTTIAWSVRRTQQLEIVESREMAQLGWLVHGFSTRPGGKSLLDGKAALNLGYTDWDERKRVVTNRAKFAAALTEHEMPLVTLHQIHSDVIHVVGEPPVNAPQADALATRTPGLLLGVQTADCVPILLADTRQRVVAAIHAGWRGTLARIAVKALGRMRMEFGTRPRDVIAAIGPAIGRCCYEVGPEVAQAFAAQFPGAAAWFDGPFEQLAHGEEPLWLPWLTMMPPGHVPPPPRVQLDLRAANHWQLVDVGVPEANIAASDLCTACRMDLLFSYRRERAKTGRMMAVIGVRGKK